MRRLQGLALMILCVAPVVCAPQLQADRADALVRELREFPAALPAAPRSDGSRDPTEERRERVYAQLLEIGADALPALARGLSDSDVQVRRNAALFLGIAGASWYQLSLPARRAPCDGCAPVPDASAPRTPNPPLNITVCLPALIAALSDGDARVRRLAAGAIDNIGPAAVSAVPSLIALLADLDEGSRNHACIALAAIGPAARDALPALRAVLSDPSADVRRCARRAIDRIDK